jgi:hypothetical protein
VDAVSRSRAILLGALALLALPGAVPPDDHRTHPELETRIAAVRTLGLVEPTVDAFELEANGLRVARPDWSELGRANVVAALEKELGAHGFAVKPVAPAGAEAKEELRQVQLLYEAVGGAIVQATYSNAFPWKLDRFEYSVGDVRALTAAAGVDGLVFTYAVANISSGGRIALQVFGGAGSGVDWLILGVVDRTGEVLWFARVHSTVSDVRDPQTAAVLVRNATDRLPRRAP